MRKCIAYATLVVFISFSFIYSISIIPPERDYPVLEINPESPVEGEVVIVEYIKGMHNNGCVPSYKTSYEIELLPYDIYPPHYAINISYEEQWPGPEVRCLMIPTEYGPSYTFEKLNVGTYNVYDNKTMIGSFKVGLKRNVLKGTVIDDPYPLKIKSQPIAGATVYIGPQIYYLAQNDTIHTLAEDNESNAFILNEMYSDSTITDKKGNYQFTRVPMGTYRIVVKAKGFQAKTVNTSIQNDTIINFTLLSEDAVSSFYGQITTVHCPGPQISAPCMIKAVAQCTVKVQLENCFELIGPTPMDQSLWKPRCLVYSAISDENGKYVIENIPVSENGQRVTITASADGFKQMVKESTLYNTQKKRVDFQLEKSFVNSDTTSNDGLLFIVSTEKKRYNPGENLKVRYGIYNGGMGNITYGPFSGNCEYDLKVTDPEGRILYLLSESKHICTRNIVYVEIGPDSLLTHNFGGWNIPLESVEYLNVTASLRGEKYSKSSATVKVLVNPSTSVAQTKTFVPAEKGIGFNSKVGMLTVSVEKNQPVSIDLYGLNGAHIAQIIRNEYLTKGIHRFSILENSDVSGMAVVKIKGKDFSYVEPISILK